MCNIAIWINVISLNALKIDSIMVAGDGLKIVENFKLKKFRHLSSPKKPNNIIMIETQN